MEKASQVAAIIAAVTGVFALAFLVALEQQRMAQWELWDVMRRSFSDDATILIAKLRNDPNGRYTESVLQWLTQQGKRYHELGRSWSSTDAEPSVPRERDQALERTSSLALVEGFVGAEGPVLHVWPRGTYTSKDVRFARGDDWHAHLTDTLENAMVEGLQNEVLQAGPRLGNNEHYKRLRERARQTREQLTDPEWQDRAAFTIAYIENIRADKKGETEAHRQAFAIYEHLLENAQGAAARLPLLVNLGVAEFRVAKRESSVEAATAAIDRWSQAERIAADLVLIDAWARTRTFQTEADLLLAEIERLGERRFAAAKRQLETLQDTQGILSEGTTLATRLWLTKASQAGAPEAIHDGVPTGPPLEAGAATRVGSPFDSIRWTDEEYRARQDRTGSRAGWTPREQGAPRKRWPT